MVRRATHGARAPCPRWPTDGWIKLSHAGTGHTLDGNYYIGTVPGATGQLGNGYTLQERLARRGKAIARRRCPGGALLSHPQLNSLRLGRWRWRTQESQYMRAFNVQHLSLAQPRALAFVVRLNILFAMIPTGIPNGHRDQRGRLKAQPQHSLDTDDHGRTGRGRRGLASSCIQSDG